MRVLIVGAGIMGLSLARALLARGHQPVLFEQGPVPNPLGTSVDQHRLIRYPYGDSLAYTRMITPAYAAWDGLWRDLGRTLYYQTGTLALTGENPAPWYRQSLHTLAAAQIAFDRLSPAELASRYPFLALRNVTEGLYLGSGGVLLAGAIVQALAAWLGEQGVVIHPHSRVSDIDVQTARLTLADGRQEQGDVVVAATGAWTLKLLPSLADTLTPSRQVVVYTDPPAQWAKAWANAPMLLDIDPSEGFYVVPPVPGTGLKVGDHRFSMVGDPDASREGADAEASALMAQLRPHLTDGADYQQKAAKVCFYTVAAEERFLMQPLGPAGWVASCCSGHGFKFGALMGDWLGEALHSGNSAGLTQRVAGF